MHAFHALACPGLPWPALPGPARPCPARPCPALPCPALPCPALPGLALCRPLHITSMDLQSHSVCVGLGRGHDLAPNCGQRPVSAALAARFRATSNRHRNRFVSFEPPFNAAERGKAFLIPQRNMFWWRVDVSVVRRMRLRDKHDSDGAARWFGRLDAIRYPWHVFSFGRRDGPMPIEV